jgi:hypothetical protein
MARFKPKFDGDTLKQQGLDLVESHTTDFCSTMRRAAKACCMVRGHVTTDYLREYAACHDIEPHHPNAWGAIFRGKHWVPVGFTKSRLPSNHSRIIRVWKWVK